MRDEDVELRHLWRGPGQGSMYQALHLPTGKQVTSAVGWDEPSTRVAKRLLRELADIVPPESVSLDRSWLTATVVSLAQGIYDDRAFARLPILADALEDAGCTNADLLNHCRRPGEHVRGCWAVSLLLGKE